MTTTTIADNVRRVQAIIADACARANRDPADITLVAVSKRKPVSDVLAALEGGVQHFGENRVEEAQEKLPEVADRIGGLPQPTWHMVGHVQSRKVKDVIPLFPIIHSVDSVKLASKLAKTAGTMITKPTVYIQVNVSGEDSKYGLQGHNWQADAGIRERLMEEIGSILAEPHLHVQGLMTMAPYGIGEAGTRPVFRSLAALRAAVQQQYDHPMPGLSMGMTDDYPVAIEEGATVVRVGRAIFGEREY